MVITAHGHVRAARGRLLFIVGNLALGVWAVYRRQAVVADPFETLAGTWWALAELRFVVVSLQERRDRRRLIATRERAGRRA